MRKKLTTALESIKNEESEEEYEEIDLEDFTFDEVSASYNIWILVLKYWSFGAKPVSKVFILLTLCYGFLLIALEKLFFEFFNIF